MLSSNGCTFWANPDLKTSLEIVTPKDKRFKGLQTVPFDVSKIRWQPSDMFTYENEQYVLGEDRHGHISHVKMGDLSGVSFKVNRIDESPIQNLDRPEVRRYGIISPRYSQTELKEQPRMRVFPNLHNGFVEGLGNSRYWTRIS